MMSSDTAGAEEYCPICNSVRMAHCSEPEHCGNTLPCEPKDEEASCMLCGRTDEIEALVNSCARAGCPHNALLDAVPIVKEQS